MNQMRGAFALLAAAVVVTALLSGCGDDGSAQFPLQSVSERASPAADRTIVYAAFAGTGQLFVFSIQDNGSNNKLLTPLDSDGDLSNDGGFHPAWSPDASTIAFVRTDGGNNDVFTMGSGGGTATPLTTDTNSDMHPCYSRQGGKIAFVSNRAGTNDIWIMDPNGTNQVRVTNLPGDDAADDQWPCFDDTGNFIAYQSTAEDPADPDAVEDTDIWVVEIANPANRTNLTKGVQNSSNQGAPSWSPDGTKILYHDDRAGSFDIWVMDSNGSNMTQLVDNPLSQGFPVWYSDGSRFAFVEARAIWTAAADGSDLTQVTRSLVQP